MSGLRQLLLIVLLISGLGNASAQEPQTSNELNQELVSARIQTLRDSGSQEGAETTIGSYEAVLNWLGEAQVHAASEKTYLQAQIDAPVQESEIRDRIETMEYRSVDIGSTSVAKLSEEKLNELLVPNKEFVTGRLLNWTLSDSSIRMTLDVGIAYGSDVRKAVAVLEDILDKHELIADDPEPDVIFNKFGDSSLNLTARYFFTDVQQRGFLLSDLHTRINEAFAEAGIVIAFPQIDVHFDREDKTDALEGEPQAT